MIKQFLFFIGLIISHFSIAQNVGIGTNTPSSKLEVKGPSSTSIKVSSANFEDTSQLILSNRNSTGEGSDFLITARREQGLYFTVASDLALNRHDSMLTLLKGGNVGIGNTLPTAKLDVNGGIKIRGTNLLELGATVAGKETNAGKIGYNAFGQNALTFVGAGTSSTNRALYFYGEGGSTFNGPLTVTGNTNIGGSISVNGSSGAVGQVLTSNGIGSPSWKPQSFTNTSRFSVVLSGNTNIRVGNCRITETIYNRSAADFTIGAETISFSKAGLYHFDINFSVISEYGAQPLSYPNFDLLLNVGYATPITLKNRQLLAVGSSDNAYFTYSYQGTTDIYIAAPANVSLSYQVRDGNNSGVTVQGHLSGYLISE